MPERDDPFKRRLETILQNAKEPEAARHALGLLFPKAERILKTYASTNLSDLRERRRRRRLSTADHAANYFRLDPRPAAWGRDEIERLLKLPNPRDALSEVEARIRTASEIDRSKLRRFFLQELDGAFRPSLPFSKPWLLALVECSPDYIKVRDEDFRFLFSEDNEDRLRRIVVRALTTIPQPDRSFLLQSVIPVANDVTLLCGVLRTVVGDKHPDGARNDRITEASLGRSR